MYKILHRFFTTIIAFGVFGVTIYLTTIKLNIPMFLCFLISVFITTIALALFVKIPIRCDQSGCSGTAILEFAEHLKAKMVSSFPCIRASLQ